MCSIIRLCSNKCFDTHPFYQEYSSMSSFIATMGGKNSDLSGLWILKNSTNSAINEIENSNIIICITMLLSCFNKNEVLFAQPTKIFSLNMYRPNYAAAKMS